MFRLLGSSVARYWPLFLAGWALALALAWTLAPSWDAVTEVGEVSSLPASAPSVRANRLYRDAFPLEYSSSSGVLVFFREDRQLDNTDKRFLEEKVLAGLGQIAAEDPDSLVTTIRSIAVKREGPLLLSPNKKATLVLVELTAAFQDPRSIPLINKIEALLDKLRAENQMPPGLEAAMTGSATAGRDLQQAEMASIRMIEIWTIVVVVLLLLLLYRAPLVAVIPLATVFVAVSVAIPILASLAGAGVLSLFRDLRIFITVLAYGAGVDYCLFLVARYREELDAGAPPVDAIARAIERVGGAITASAATVIAGIGMLAFAQFAKIHQAGIVIPLALTIVLLATLTMGGALLCLAGPWAFWPGHIAPEAAHQDRGHDRPGLLGRLLGRRTGVNIWGVLASLVLRRPGTIWLSAVALMAPFVLLAARHASDINFNPLGDLPPGAASAAGTRALEKHFPPGVIGNVTLLVEHDKIDFSTPRGAEAIARLTERIVERKDELELADVRSFALPLGTGPAAQERIAQLHGTKEQIEAAVREEALPYYVSQMQGRAGHVTRLELTLGIDPLARHGIAALHHIETVLPQLLPAELSDARVHVVGPTASLRDLSNVKRSDERLIQLLVPVVVFGLLLLLLRRVVVSLYLIVSVLFSYYATLGLTYVVFAAIYGADFDGLDWKVPIFLFTILVAVGEDYNIFLLTRVQEEQARHGPLAAVPIALARTGSVISSCGFIMAGTFASLLSGSLRALQELGFALAVGVLADTLIVRPLLVPAFLVLLQRLIPGPLGRYMALGQRPPKESKEVKVHAEANVQAPSAPAP